MITCELDASKEGIEIFLNEADIEEFISYLRLIKEQQDHFHLVVGNELGDTKMHPHNTLIKHIKLIYMESE